MSDYDTTNFAEGKGWTVISIDVEPITYEFLYNQNVKILRLTSVHLPYTDQEIQELVKFVDNGGGLLIRADDPHDFYNKEITREFGIMIREDSVYPYLSVTVDSTHSLMEEVGVFF